MQRWQPALRSFPRRSAKWLVRSRSHEEAFAFMTPVLEELSEFEVELPARCRAALGVNLVEPIPYVHSQRSERAYRRDTESSAPEQTSGIELTRLVPDIAALEARVQVQRLIQPQAEFRGSYEERIAERRSAGLGVRAARVKAIRRHRECVVATLLLAILSAAHVERLRREERARVAE